MASDIHVLDCGTFRAVFATNGALTGLESAFRKKPLLDLRPIKGNSPFRIIRRALGRRSGGKTYTLNDFSLQMASTPPGSLVFEGPSLDGSLRVTMIARATDSGALAWTLRVVNRRGNPVWLVAFPIVEGLIWTRGQRITIPHNSGFSVDPAELEENEELFLNYPVHASMQWLDLYAPTHGVYLGVHDELPHVKQFAVGRSGHRLRMEWRYPDVVLRAGETWAVPEATLAVHRGDWHAGADRYREWAHNWISFPDPPEWFARLPAWSWISGKGNHAPRPQRRFRDLPAALDVVRRETGVPVAQLAGWMEHGHDTHYPDYVPGECMGGKSGLLAALDRIHRDGGRLSLYTNGRLIDPEGSVGSMRDWQRFCIRLAPCAKENAAAFLGTFTRKNAWDRSGGIAKEKYGRTLFAVACPHARDWQNLFIDRVLRLVRTYPIDGLYLDQVCGATCLPCYSAEHGHSRPNLAWRGYIDLLGELREAVKKVRNGIYLSTEGVNDLFGSFFDAQQSHNDWTAQLGGKGEDLTELFRYTFPESLDLIGPTAPGQEEYLRLGLAVAGGFDCFSIFPGSSQKAFRDFMKETLTLRGQLSPYIRGAQPLSSASTRSTQLKVFGLEGRRHVLVTGGWRGKRRGTGWTVQFRPSQGDEFRAAELWNPHPRPLKWHRAKGIVTFHVPFTKTFAALFLR
jgi:hypothetical protein